MRTPRPRGLRAARAEEAEENWWRRSRGYAIETSDRGPTGVVVAIVRRSWRERGYAASIDVGPAPPARRRRRRRRTARARAPRPRGSWPCRWTVAFRRSAFRRARRPRSPTSASSSSCDQWPRTRPTPRDTTCARSVRSATWTRRRRRFCSRRTWTTARSRPRCTRASLPCLGVSTSANTSSRQPHREDLPAVGVFRGSAGVSGHRRRAERQGGAGRRGRDLGRPRPSRAWRAHRGRHEVSSSRTRRWTTRRRGGGRRRTSCRARLDMLPKPLTEDICSLRGGVERLTFSVFFRFDKVTNLPVPGNPAAVRQGRS